VVVSMLAGAQVPWIGPASVGVASLGTKIETASAGDPVWLKVDALVKAHARLDMSSGTLLVARHRGDYGRCGRGVKGHSLSTFALTFALIRARHSRRHSR